MLDQTSGHHGPDWSTQLTVMTVNRYRIAEVRKLSAREGIQYCYEMVRQHHRLNGHELEQTPADSGGQGGLACCSPWGCRVIYDLVIEQQ